MTTKPERFWKSSYQDWRPRLWFYVLPYRGGDEYGRLTWVIHIPLWGFLVWAYRTCPCEECEGIREQTAYWESQWGEDGWSDEILTNEKEQKNESPGYWIE